MLPAKESRSLVYRHRRHHAAATAAAAEVRQSLFVTAMAGFILFLHCSRMDCERGDDRLLLSDEVAALGRSCKRQYRVPFPVFTVLVSPSAATSSQGRRAGSSKARPRLVEAMGWGGWSCAPFGGDSVGFFAAVLRGCIIRKRWEHFEPLLE